MTNDASGTEAHGTAYGVDIGAGLLRVVRAEANGTFTPWQHPAPVVPGGPGRGVLDDAALPTLLRPRTGAAHRVVAAVPHSRLGPSPDGRPETEEVRNLRAVLSACGAQRTELVSAPLAALTVPAVRAVLPSGYSRVVVADLGAGHSELVLCDTAGAVPRALAWTATEPSGAAPDPHWELAGIGLPSASPPRADRLRLAQELISRLHPDEAERSELAVEQARDERAKRAAGDGPDDEIKPLWQHIEVYRSVLHPDNHHLTCGQVLDVLNELAQPLGELAARLRQSDPAVREAGLLVLGGGSVFAPLRHALARGLGLPADAPVRTAPLPVLAAAQGAALVAARSAPSPEALRQQPAPDIPRQPAGTPVRLAVVVHRAAGDRVEEWLAPLPVPASPAAEFLRDPCTGADAVCDWGGPASLSLWIRPPGADGFAPLAVEASRIPVPAGRYRIGTSVDAAARPLLVFAGAGRTDAAITVAVADAAPAAFADDGTRPTGEGR
ncbi:hypothetical protein [Streptomyces sp. SD15]